jgi:uncharacterized membrane protein YhaH (DUF805 family)
MAIQLGKKEEQVKYYYSINGTQFGPYDLAMLLSKIDSNTLVWREGIEWTNASNVEELKKFFNKSADLVVEPTVQYTSAVVTEDAASASPKKMFAAPFSFDGRIRRKEYGISVIIFYFLYVGIAAALLKGRSSSGFMGVLYIPLIWFILAQGAKRCHDRNNSGWYQIIPFYGLWMLFADGDAQANNFGNSPK